MAINIYFILIVLLLGLSLMLAEILVYSYGTLAISGLIAFALGIAMLVNHDLLTLHTAGAILAAMAIVNVLFLGLGIGAIIKARTRKPVSGIETLIGQTAIVNTDFHHHAGWVLIKGELWQAQAEQNFKKGAEVQIIKIKGLKLLVQ